MHRNDPDPAYDVLVDLLSTWQQAFDDNRSEDIAALFTEDALFQGYSPKLRIGPAEITDYYNDVAAGAKAEVRVLQGNQVGANAVAGFADVTFTSPTGITTAARLSVTAQFITGAWRIRQYHAAPAPS
ncbi:SgcJ/EcaC family oxidoreductase [Streptomyces sp. NPDC008343]|uniref:SgcJ/EcaC family oxidoreductase n=1 Tax=Streptomyces sp. NPDC008343 TaxID=3364828 RepID=UPI0036E3F314